MLAFDENHSALLAVIYKLKTLLQTKKDFSM